MIGTTEAFTRQPINQLDCNTVGIRFWCRQRRGLVIMGYGASQN